MKLQKFKEENNKQKSIIIFTIACVLLITGVFLYKTFASFQVIENEDLINGSIEDPGDIYFVFYKDNQITKEMPKKGTGYAYDYEKSSCNKGAVPYFDSIDWSITVKGMNESHTKCTLYFYKGYQDPNLDGTDPVLERPLIPVHIDNTGKVTKADPSQKWYDYEKKEWANAVILVDETKKYEIDQEIEEKDIESYFVWIPRYKYKLKADEATFNSYSKIKATYTNVNNVEEFYSLVGGNQALNNAFEIEFENITTPPSNDNTKDGWLTHPAFTAFNSNGFWVGKFETGYKDATSTSTAEANNEEPSKVIIKPNVYSWRSINVSNAFYTSYKYQRELDSHMMKNTEWGAVVYLTQSKYGRCNSGTCEEVRINNNNSYITGYSAKNEPTVGSSVYHEYEKTELGADGTNTYNYTNQISKLSSTTGNYTGIYDMSGGAFELVMGVMKVKNGTPASGKDKDTNSGFKGPYSSCIEHGGKSNCNGDIQNITGREWPSSKYYDLYDYNELDQQYQRGILGDGTKEFGPFYGVSYNENPPRDVGNYYSDLADFVYFGGPWFLRGATVGHGVDAGVSAFGYDYGNGSSNRGFRIVLTL